jgi:hypothetical protein
LWTGRNSGDALLRGRGESVAIDGCSTRSIETARGVNQLHESELLDSTQPLWLAFIFIAQLKTSQFARQHTMIGQQKRKGIFHATQWLGERIPMGDSA